MAHTEFDDLKDQEMEIQKEFDTLDILSHREDVSEQQASLQTRLQGVQDRLDKITGT